MKKALRLCCQQRVFLIIVVCVCACHMEIVTPTRPAAVTVTPLAPLPTIPTASATATISPTSTPEPTRTPPPATPTGTVLPPSPIAPSPTVTPNYLVHPLSEALSSGQYLAFAAGNQCQGASAICDLWAVSVDGSVDQILAENLPSEAFIYHAGRVAFTSYIPPDYDHTTIQTLDLENGRLLQVPVPADQKCRAEDWSSDGKELVVLCDSGTDYPVADINLLSVPGGELALLLHESNGFDFKGYEQPRWSPDGKWLTFFRPWAHGPRLIEGLYVIDMTCVAEPSACQAKTRRLPVERLTGKLGNRRIAWSPDGHLARAIDNLIEIYDVRTWQRVRALQVATNEDYIFDMAWSSNGNWVAVTQSYTPGILLISIPTGKVVRLLDSVTADDLFWITMP